MAGHGSTAGLMVYGDANAVAMEIGEHEVPPHRRGVPVICGVHASDPRRRMWHWLLKVKDMGFSGVNNFPTHCIVDGQFRQIPEETGMSVKKEFEMVASRTKWTSSRLSTSPRPTKPAMAEAGADAIIAHVGTTIGGSIGVKAAAISLDDAVKRVQAIYQRRPPRAQDIFFLSHGGPISTPDDAAYVNERTDCVGFVGASAWSGSPSKTSLTSLAASNPFPSRKSLAAIAKK